MARHGGQQFATNKVDYPAGALGSDCGSQLHGYQPADPIRTIPAVNFLANSPPLLAFSPCNSVGAGPPRPPFSGKLVNF